EKRVASALITRLKLMSGLDISEKRLPQDGRFQVLVKDHHVDVRLSTLPIQGGESVVMRLLDQTGNILSVDQLGMPPGVSERYRRLMKRPHGLVLVTGPTGSGKTTTLYSALNEINDPQTKIITVEDPVEYRLTRINQVQVNPKIDLTFARVLRAVLRQDPDVVMIGEMRDQETAEIALRAAMTGHLVFSTLHTNDAVSTVNRLIDMGVPGYMVATALEGVIAQRLLRRVCDSCQRPYEPTPGERAWLRDLLKADADRLALMTGVGCAYCNNTGYRGRVGVYELLEMDRAMTDALRRDDGAAFEQAALASPDFVSLAQVGLQYAARGVTSLAEVIRATGGVDESFDIAAPASVVTQG
ncbi:MAG: GspE/PulE family protein, partial [Pseudomonadota bacterium]|nr:GspE/PulE family protein [Pseudomonadota bacterium]